MANIAHYCLHELKILPHEFIKLSTREKAFIIASIQIRIEAEKKALKGVKHGRN